MLHKLYREPLNAGSAEGLGKLSVGETGILCLQNSEGGKIPQVARYPELQFFGGAGEDNVFAVVPFYALPACPGKGVVAVEIKQQGIFGSSSKIDNGVTFSLMIDDIGDVWLCCFCYDCCFEDIGYLLNSHGHVHPLRFLSKEIGDCGGTVWHDQRHIHGSRKF